MFIKTKEKPIVKIQQYPEPRTNDLYLVGYNFIQNSLLVH